MFVSNIQHNMDEDTLKSLFEKVRAKTLHYLYILTLALPFVSTLMCTHVTASVFVHVLMRDEREGRKKQARSNKQQGKATQHTQGSHFSYEK